MWLQGLQAGEARPVSGRLSMLNIQIEWNLHQYLFMIITFILNTVTERKKTKQNYLLGSPAKTKQKPNPAD